MHRSYWNRLLHSKKMIFVIFAAFSLHLLILLRTEPDAYLYQQMWKQLPQEQMTTMQQEECLRYVKREQKRQKKYAAHIQNICENAKSMQVFSFFAKEGSFDQKNLQSTLEQYEGKEKIQISGEPGAGVVVASDGLLMSGILLLLVLTAAQILFVDDKVYGRKKLFLATRHGRGKDYLIRVLTLVEMTVIGYVILVGTRVLYAEICYGIGDRNRSIQSVWKYIDCIKEISVKQFLEQYYIQQFLVILAAVMAIICFSQFATRSLWLYLGGSIFAGAELAAYQFVSENSWLALLRKINLFSYLQMEDRLGTFENLNIAGNPVNEEIVRWFVVGLVMAVSFLLGWWYYGRTLRQGRGLAVFRHKKHVWGCHGSLWGHEAYKVFVTERVIYLLAFLFVIMAVITPVYHDEYQDEDSFYYYYYIHKFEGKFTAEKELQIEKEKDNFATWKAQFTATNSEYERNKIEKNLRREEGFQRFLKKCDYVKAHPGAELVDDRAFEILEGKTNPWDKAVHWGIGILAIVFCLVGLWNADTRYGCDIFVMPTVSGCGRLQRIRTCYAVLITVLIAVILYAIQFFRVIASYTELHWTALAVSLEPLYAFGSGVSIKGYFALLYALRFIGLLVCGIGICLYSGRRYYRLLER